MQRARLGKWLSDCYVFIGFNASGIYIIMVVCKSDMRGIVFSEAILPFYFLNKEKNTTLSYNSYQPLIYFSFVLHFSSLFLRVPNLRDLMNECYN